MTFISMTHEDLLSVKYTDIVDNYTPFLLLGIVGLYILCE